MLSGQASGRLPILCPLNVTQRRHARRLRASVGSFDLPFSRAAGGTGCYPVIVAMLAATNAIGARNQEAFVIMPSAQRYIEALLVTHINQLLGLIICER